MLNPEGRHSLEIPSTPGSERVYKIKDEDPGKQHDKKTKEQETASKKQPSKSVTPPQEKPEVQQPVSKPVIDTTNKEEDPDSVLSFNFLHYIIQRFKFSEVLEQ